MLWPILCPMPAQLMPVSNAAWRCGRRTMTSYGFGVTVTANEIAWPVSSRQRSSRSWWQGITMRQRCKSPRLVLVGSVAVLLLTSCIDPGPMEQLRGSMSAMTIPETLQPAKLPPWTDLEWDTLEMDDGRNALVWEGPRGIDNDTAWMLSGWEFIPDATGGDVQDQACVALQELVEQSAPDQAVSGLTTKLDACESDKWPEGRTFGVSWESTTEGVSVDYSATLKRTRAGDYAVEVHVTER